jgi:putative transcriptional regulator
MGSGGMVKNRLKEIRMREYMMNLTQFAEFLGSDLKTYSGWEKGSTPTLKKSLEVSIKLNKNVNEIWYLD